MTRREKRQQRRLARKTFRRERRESFNAMIDAIKATPELTDDDADGAPYKEKFEQYWPAIDKTLAFLIELKLTGKKADKVLTAFQEVGDRMAEGDPIDDPEIKKILDKILKWWKRVRKVLHWVTIFTGDDVDKVINKIIEVIDWILGENYDAENDDEGEADEVTVSVA